MVTKDDVVKALKQCIDPEIRLDVHLLGLIYNIDIQNENVNILMTLTSPMCPYGPWLVDDVKSKIKTIANAKDVNVDLTFTPAWKPSEEIKMMLGLQ